MKQHIKTYLPLLIILLLIATTIGADDTTDPDLQFVFPTPDDDASQSVGIVDINVSIAEENLSSLTYNWDGTNTTIYDDSLVLMYNFDNIVSLGEDNSVVVDLSGNSNNATVHSATWSQNQGKYNGAFQFDGADDYLDVGIISSDNPLMLDNSAFTISAWIYHNPDDNYQRLVDKSTGNGGDDGYAIYIYNDGDIKLAVDNVAELKVEPYYQGIDMNIGWHYITAIATDSYFTIYVDCINITTRSMQGTPTLPPNYETNLLIGNWNEGDRYWNGSIDELRIWNKALSQEEIYYHYATNLHKHNQTHWLLNATQQKTTNEELDIGTYTYQVFATDIGDNQASSEQRTIHITGPTPPVPEATTLLLMTSGLILLGGFFAHKKKK